jgi:hypothetical protein
MQASGKAPMSEWKPDDVRKMIVCGTGCVCLIALVTVVLIGAMLGKLSVDLLGSFSKGGAVGCGLLGVSLIIYRVIKVSLK